MQITQAMLGKLGIIFLTALVLSACMQPNQAPFNIVSNDPQSTQCYNTTLGTAKNCQTLSDAEVLHAKQEWKITAYRYKHELILLKDTAEIRYNLRFDDGEIKGDLGCNSFLGRYTLEDGILTVHDAGMTRKACAKEAIELNLTRFLFNSPTKILVISQDGAVGKIFLLGEDFYLVLD